MEEKSVLNKMIDTPINSFDYQTLFVTYGFKILGSLIILLIAFIIMKIVGKALDIALTKARIDETLVIFLVKLIKITILVFGILAMLNNLGVNTTSFVALFTATSFAISFAFKETLSNIAAGVLLVIFRPFKLKEYVKLGAGEGFVSNISLFSTTLRTNDNINIIVPNSKVVSDNIYNYSREKIRRIDLSKIIKPQELCESRKELLNILNNCDLVLKEPAIFIGVKNINDADIEISIQIWVENINYDRALMQINEALLCK
ncbi:mechanosensitive ion channel family protein [Campylobacter sp. MG1]|uniref:mechanosensitive ion channel family protein n=1 Tax=Campylobacter sp. MG1 TaxID=2976332 RepID=UPI00226D2500|nr:mechanosensitive ion channel domain-containing protein [Campylobacter sp. MG1]